MGKREKASEKGVTMHGDATHVWIGHQDNKVTAGWPLRRRTVVLFRSFEGEGDK